MYTYEILTTHGKLRIKGTDFKQDENGLTGERGEYAVLQNSAVVARIAAEHFVAVEIIVNAPRAASF